LKQFLITPASGKRLIAKTLANHPAILKALKSGTIAIIAGTTNGYVAEEILKTHQIPNDFSRKHFFRGITLPRSGSVTGEGLLQNGSKFPGDVIIIKGACERNTTLNDVIDKMCEGDVILKGANALDLNRKQAAILIGNPKAGTIGLTLPTVVGRRLKLIIPVGLEKRVSGDLFALAEKMNTPFATGYRLLPVPGEVFTEIDALTALTGANVELVASGGVCGAEGACLLAVTGSRQQEEFAEQIYKSIADEPAFGPDYI